jgi:hypothetical protein
MRELIRSNEGILLFFVYLENEHNSLLLKTYLKSEWLLKTCDFLPNEDFNIQTYNYLKKYYDDFNFDSKFLNRIQEEISFIEGYNFDYDKEKIISLLDDISNKLFLNMIDPYERFNSEEKKTEFSENEKEVLENSETKNIILEKEWTFNIFSFYSPKIYENRDPVVVSQFLYFSFINFEKENQNEKMNPKDFLYVKQNTLELVNIKTKNLKINEKLCFYMNIFNTLILHLKIQLENALPKSSEEFQAMLYLCSYNIGGKTMNLKKMKEKILKYYKLLTFQQNLHPQIVFFTLTSLFKTERKPIKKENILETIMNTSKIILLESILIKKDQIIVQNIIKELFENSTSNHEINTYKNRALEEFNLKKTKKKASMIKANYLLKEEKKKFTEYIREDEKKSFENIKDETKKNNEIKEDEDAKEKEIIKNIEKIFEEEKRINESNKLLEKKMSNKRIVISDTYFNNLQNVEDIEDEDEEILNNLSSLSIKKSENDLLKNLENEKKDLETKEKKKRRGLFEIFGLTLKKSSSESSNKFKSLAQKKYSPKSLSSSPNKSKSDIFDDDKLSKSQKASSDLQKSINIKILNLLNKNENEESFLQSSNIDESPIISKKDEFDTILSKSFDFNHSPNFMFNKNSVTKSYESNSALENDDSLMDQNLTNDLYDDDEIFNSYSSNNFEEKPSQNINIPSKLLKKIPSKKNISDSSSTSTKGSKNSKGSKGSKSNFEDELKSSSYFSSSLYLKKEIYSLKKICFDIIKDSLDEESLNIWENCKNFQYNDFEF